MLGAPVDEETTARDIQESDRGTIVASLHWCLRDRAAHKKRIYDARLALPIRAVAAAAAPREIKGASTLAFRAIKAQAGKARPPLGDAPLIERVVEVGVPEAWDAAQLLTIATTDTRETRLAPKRTVAQRWAAAVAPRRRDEEAPAAAVRGHPPDGARRRHAARALGLPAPGRGTT